MLVRQFEISALPNAFITILVSLSVLIMPLPASVTTMSALDYALDMLVRIGLIKHLLAVKSSLSFQTLEVF